MTDQTKTKIFLAGARALKETDTFRIYNTVNDGSHHEPAKLSLANLQLVNEEVLAAGKAIKRRVHNKTAIILLPLVGTVVLRSEEGTEIYIGAGEAYMFTADKGGSFEIANPYDEGLVSYLQYNIYLPTAVNIIKQLSSFHLQSDKNRLISLFPIQSDVKAVVPAFKFSIGKFAGRKEVEYTLSEKDNAAFVFVIEGAFEVQNRLIESRDGLALWNTEKIEMESLSENAIIVLLELDSHQSPSESKLISETISAMP
jgi:redox-sensitive bicupin YhaK (pirin superfamily)